MELKWRKMLSLLLSMVLTLSLFPASARADEGGTEDNVPKNEFEITLSAAADELGEDAALVVPEAEDSEGAVDEDAGLVRVLFICDPEDAVVTVYDPMNLDDEGGYLVVDPEEDGSWLLSPRAYLYNAVCEGYWCAYGEQIFVDNTEDTQTIEVFLPEECLESAEPFFPNGVEIPQAASSREAAILQRINTLYSIISNCGGYFNDQCDTSCGFDKHKSCSHCKLANIVKATWFKNAFGSVSTNQFFINNSGECWSCVSFATFAAWYVFRADNSDTVYRNSSETKEVSFNYSNIASYASIGDYLRLGTHSAILVGYDSNGITVLDSNYGHFDGKASCAVRIHSQITYSDYSKVSIVKIHSKRLGDNQFDDGPTNPTTYTVTYNANGGYGAPSPQTKTHGVNLTLSSAEPSRSSTSAGSYTVTLDPNGGSVSITRLVAARTESYIFQKWNTAANGNGTSYAPGATYSANASVTLYAQWYSSLSTAPITLPTPTRSGFVFKGWATDPSYSAGVNGSYMPTRDLTLYAIWASDAPKITISTSEIELDRVDHPSEKLYYTYSGDTENGYYISAEVTEPGVVSLSWGSEPKDHLAITGLKPGYVIVTIKLVEYNTERTLSAAYCGVSITDPRTYVITFDANGGYGAPEPKIKTHDVDILVEGIAKRDSVYGEMLTLCFDATGGTVEPCEAHAQKITAYSFLAWNTAPDGSGTQFKNCFSYTGNADLTLYAQWDSIATSTSFTLPEPSWPGHRFLGWAAYKGGEPRYSAGMRVTLRASGTIYAVWEIMRIPGDVNGDGSVNGQDLIRLRKYLAGETVEIDLSNADVNGDGQVDGRDLIRLRKYLAGEDVVLV